MGNSYTSAAIDASTRSSFGCSTVLSLVTVGIKLLWGSLFVSQVMMYRAQILIGRESLQSHVPVFKNRPVMIFVSVNKSHVLQNLGHFGQPLLKNAV